MHEKAFGLEAKASSSFREKLKSNDSFLTIKY